MYVGAFSMAIYPRFFNDQCVYVYKLSLLQTLKVIHGRKYIVYKNYLKCTNIHVHERFMRVSHNCIKIRSI